jgi:hypothetical protein
MPKAAATQPRTRGDASRDLFSTLPFELFRDILSYTRSDSSQNRSDFPTLKALSTLNKTIRAKCLALGLLKNVVIKTTVALNQLYHFLKSRSRIALAVRCVTLYQDVLTAPSSILHRILPMLKHIAMLRIQGDGRKRSKILSNDRGRLSTLNSAIYKVFANYGFLPELAHVELVRMEITQFIVDLVVTAHYSTLTLTDCTFREYPDIVAQPSYKVKYLDINSYTSSRHFVPFLYNSCISQSLTHITLSLHLLFKIFDHSTARSCTFSKVFPKLTTINVTGSGPPDVWEYPGNWRNPEQNFTINIRTLIWTDSIFTNPVINLPNRRF